MSSGPTPPRPARSRPGGAPHTSHTRLDDPRRLYAELHPVGLWSEPCDVSCVCGYHARATTCPEAQRLAWQHDADHWAGKGQPSLF